MFRIICFVIVPHLAIRCAINKTTHSVTVSDFITSPPLFNLKCWFAGNVSMTPYSCDLAGKIPRADILTTSVTKGLLLNRLRTKRNHVK